MALAGKNPIGTTMFSLQVWKTADYTGIILISLDEGLNHSI